MTPNTPMTELPVELEPCPFCHDPMEIRFDVIRHQNQGDCPIGAQAWDVKFLPAWNRRASQSLRAPAGEVVAWRLTTREGVEHLFNVEDNARSYAEATGGFVTPLYASPPSEGVKVTDEMIEGMCRAFVGHYWDGETEFLKDQYRSNMRRAVTTLGGTP